VLQIDSFQWGVGRGISSPAAAGSTNREKNAPNVHELLISLPANRAIAPTLLNELTASHKISSVVLYQGSQNANTFTPNFQATFVKVRIRNISFSGGDQIPTMQVALVFHQAKVTYGSSSSLPATKFGNAGSTTSAWSRVTNSPCDVC
jgi:hypothetical protein